MRVSLTLLCLLLTSPALGQGAGGQGFAGLGTEAPEFALPDPATRMEFPRDHGPHPEFRIEWWYLTANLTGADGTAYGIQWTLFRSALAPEARDGWDSPQVWMAHAALTTPTAHHSAERFARDGIGQAGVVADPFAAWLDDWQMTGQAPAGADPLDRLQISARGSEFSFDLQAVAQGPLVLHGDQGFSVKAAGGQASHYYSQPFYQVTGTLMLPDGPLDVTGTGWLDREWSSQPLEGAQTGWDWFALSFDDGSRMMAAQVRSDAGAYTIGTMIAADGTARPLPDGALRFTPLQSATIAGREIPFNWRIEGAGVDIQVEALNPNSWMETTFAYWEGPIRLSGSHQGHGYLEMTGY